ncbi:hypothetical protein [Herbaspirillum huttiense]|uniref:DUF4241 domain-containing protein n=1 Tax=Herbaspirillum huttiense subsp. lycopersici TaxID=3074428 RepID=A0ABU2EFZ9_9BURK|nr:hypothetical protein [Herbaspirillum huttiense]MDR9847065.1 hypothetical protein [Herbaspirillum huttiense SE1]
MFSHINSVSAPAKFNITSGAMRVTDPCYDTATWCSGALPKVLNGEWLAQVGYFKCPSDAAGQQRWREKTASDYENRIKEYEAKLAATDSPEVHRSFSFQIEWAKADLEREREKWAKQDATYLGRVAYLRVVHSSIAATLEQPIAFSTFTATDIHVGVDSGQAGFFDQAEHAKIAVPGVSRGSSPAFESFYERICGLTCNEDGGLDFGAIEFGAAACSGYGDGGYNCHVRTDQDGNVIDAIIVFISDGSDEEGEES